MSRIRSLSLVLTLTLALAAPSAVHAAGYALHEFSAYSMGRLHATSAHLPTAETLFMNPAGIMSLPGLNISAGTALVSAGITFADPTVDPKPDASMSALLPTPSAAITYRYGNTWAIGLGFAAPYGLALDWPDEFAGESRVSKVDLRIPNAYLASAIRLTEGLSFALSGHFAPSTAELARVINRKSDGSLNNHAVLTGSGQGFGFGAGMLYEGQSWSAGAWYKSSIAVSLDGELKLGPPGSEAVIKGGTEAWTPQQVSAGFTFEPAHAWLLAFEVKFQDWSMVKDFVLDFENDTFDEAIPQDWGNSWLISAGADWVLNDEITVRAGAGYDLTPVPADTLSPLLPDAHRYLMATGLSYDFGSIPLGIDVSYMLAIFQERSTNPKLDDQGAIVGALPAENNLLPATYNTTAHWFALNLRTQFDLGPSG